jgi:hypothetical protein
MATGNPHNTNRAAAEAGSTVATGIVAVRALDRTAFLLPLPWKMEAISLRPGIILSEVPTMRRVALLLSIGLLAACGDTSTTSSNDAAAATKENDTVTSADGETPGDAATVATSRQNGSDAANVAAETEMQDARARKGETVTSLPLKRGFYVAGDTACGQASNATLMLVRKSGINSSRVPCEFKAIEKVGANSYRVTESCSEGGAAWGTEEHVSTSVSTYEIASDTSFTSKSDSGWENSARYCPQSSLPEPWRNNDIGDLTN